MVEEFVEFRTLRLDLLVWGVCVVFSCCFKVIEQSHTIVALNT